MSLEIFKRENPSINKDFQLDLRYTEDVSLKKIFHDIKVRVPVSVRNRALESKGIYIVLSRVPYCVITKKEWDKYEEYLKREEVKSEILKIKSRRQNALLNATQQFSPKFSKPKNLNYEEHR